MLKRLNHYFHHETSRKRVLASTAAGATLGIFPILGCSTPLCGLFGVIFKLNHAILQTVNQLVGVVKLVLIIPFIRFGEWLYQADPFPLSVAEFSLLFKDQGFAAVHQFSATFIHAMSGWVVLAPVIYLAAFLLIFLALPGREPKPAQQHP